MTDKIKTKKKKAINQVLEFAEVPKNEVKLGEVYMSSPNLELNQIAGLILELLKEQPVKQYLDLIKVKKAMGNYTG